MKHRLICLVAPFVLLSAQGALAQARYQQVYENSVKPGQELVYENYVKKLVAAADKVGAKYGGVDLRNMDQPGQSRVAVTLHLVRVNAIDMSAR